MKNKGYMKGQLGSIDKLIWALVGAALSLGIGLLLLASFYTQAGAFTGNNSSAAPVAIAATITALGTIPSWFGLLIVMVFVVIILMLYRSVRGAGAGGMEG